MYHSFSIVLSMVFYIKTIETILKKQVAKLEKTKTGNGYLFYN